MTNTHLPDDTIAALFTADPLTLTDPQLDALILDLRRRRLDFTSSEAAKAAAPPKERKARATVDPQVSLGKSAADLTLDDL